MKIGIYGGTFNPIHRGHLTAARAALDALGLDRLLLIPASVPPHKALPQGSADAADRLEMAALACAELGPQAQALDTELHRTGPSYTVDTLRQLRMEHPEDELWLLMGTDMFLSLERWYHASDILSLAHIGAFDRAHPQPGEDLAAQKRLLETKYGATVAIIANRQVIDLSSTQVREALAAGRGRDLVTDPVYGYIQRRGLYGVHTDLHHLTPDQLRPIALSYLKPKRMPHVLGTEQEAVRLARQYGADETQSRIAALLHDCTKKLDMDQQLALCAQYHIQLDDLEQHALKLLHAKTGAAIARDVFGVDDAVYRAIYWHTTGHPNMTKLEKIIYLADYIEPSRDFPGVEDLRRAVHADLDRGLLKALDDSIRDMQQWGNPVHHNTLDARDYLLRGKQICKLRRNWPLWRPGPCPTRRAGRSRCWRSAI